MGNNYYRNSEGYADPTFAAVMASMARQERRANRNSRRAGREYKTPGKKTARSTHDTIIAPKTANTKRLLVYICSPYAGDIDKNVENARKYCRYAVMTGYLPFAAHLLFPQFLDDGRESERSLGLSFGNFFLEKCKEVWLFGDRLSSGMKAERDHAIKRNIPIRYFTTDCIEVFQDGTGGAYGSL